MLTNLENLGQFVEMTTTTIDKQSKSIGKITAAAEEADEEADEEDDERHGSLGPRWETIQTLGLGGVSEYLRVRLYCRC